MKCANNKPKLWFSNLGPNLCCQWIAFFTNFLSILLFAKVITKLWDFLLVTVEMTKHIFCFHSFPQFAATVKLIPRKICIYFFQIFAENIMNFLPKYSHYSQIFKNDSLLLNKNDWIKLKLYQLDIYNLPHFKCVFTKKIVLQASTTKTRNLNAFFSPSKSSYLLKIEQKSIFCT